MILIFYENSHRVVLKNFSQFAMGDCREITDEGKKIVNLRGNLGVEVLLFGEIRVQNSQADHDLVSDLLQIPSLRIRHLL